MLTIYKASAGSGKTFALAFEYIKLLLGVRHPDGTYTLNHARDNHPGHRLTNRHRAILAITFTNAATAEMKKRIIGEINKLANIQDQPRAGETKYAQMLCDTFRCGRQPLRAAAALALQELLNDYSNFNVSTIDSFFQTVLRTFSREIDHQGDYELSMDRLNIIRQSMSMMLDDLNYDTSPGSRRLYKWIRSFMLQEMADGKDYNIFNRGGRVLSGLAASMNKSMNEDFVANARQLREYCSNPARVDAAVARLRSLADGLTRGMATKAEAAIKLCRSLGVAEADIKPAVYGRLCEFANARMPKDPLKLKAVRQLLDENIPLKPLDILYSKVLKTLPDADVESVAATIGDVFRTVDHTIKRGSIYRQMAQAIVGAEFISMAGVYLEEYLRQNNIMLIDDSGELLCHIISDAEMPFIYERLGMRLENLLIDEFQDTSRLQWHNLKPLVANSLSNGNDSLIIGDVKQAIYRFRNSDPSLLDTVVPEEDFPEHRARGNKPEDNTNHRSAPDIVRFNNTVFTNLAKACGLDAYSSVVQSISPAIKEQAIQGCVSVTFFEVKPPEEEIYRRMYSSIMDRHGAGYRWRDIMVLVRTNREAISLVQYFMENYPEVRMASNEALLLRNSPAVRTIMSMLALVEKMFVSERDGDGTANDSRHFATHDEIVDFDNRYHLLVSSGMEPEMALEEALRPASVDLREQILEIRRNNPASLVALIEGIIAGKLSPDEQKQQQPYLTALQDLAIKHCQSADPSISAFIRAYNNNSGRWAIQAPADLDAVQVMTVHKAKGLERDCVYIPFADWALASETEMWMPMDKFDSLDSDIRPPMLRLSLKPGCPLTDPSIAPEFCDAANQHLKADVVDNINLAYVAFTRAVRELEIYSTVDNLGRLICNAVQTQGQDTDTLMDLSSCCTTVTDDDGLKSIVFTCGTHTVPAVRKHEEPALNPPPYRVVSRNDARELVSVDDVFAEDFDIGTEYMPEITDRPDGTEAMRRAAARGNAMHAVLSAMTTRDDLGAAVNRLLTRGVIRPSEADEYRKDLEQALMTAPQLVAGWFDPRCEVFAERSVYDPAAGVTYRPDRVVRMPDGSISVIDYKFTSRTSRSHAIQARNYARIISGIEGVEAHSFLWYPLLQRVIAVDNE